MNFVCVPSLLFCFFWWLIGGKGGLGLEEERRKKLARQMTRCIFVIWFITGFFLLSSFLSFSFFSLFFFSYPPFSTKIGAIAAIPPIDHFSLLPSTPNTDYYCLGLFLFHVWDLVLEIYLGEAFVTIWVHHLLTMILFAGVYRLGQGGLFLFLFLFLFFFLFYYFIFFFTFLLHSHLISFLFSLRNRSHDGHFLRNHDSFHFFMETLAIYTHYFHDWLVFFFIFYYLNPFSLTSFLPSPQLEALVVSSPSFIEFFYGVLFFFC